MPAESGESGGNCDWVHVVYGGKCDCECSVVGGGI